MPSGLTDILCCSARREQMYKKRFAKWGFQKNSKRSAAIVRRLKTKDVCRGVVNRKTSPPGELTSLPAFLGVSHHESLALTFLTSVRTWGVAFFESLQFHGGFLASQQQPLPLGRTQPFNTRGVFSSTREINFAFKLVIDLLNRGHGDLAGRMARKAFLLVEDMLTLEGPALVWNLLEMMHHMVKLRHVQLFHILLSHIISLLDGKMSENHPLSAMLRGLRGLVASLNRAASSPSNCSLSSSSSSPSSLTDSNGKLASPDPWPLYSVLSSFLQQAWIINAEILFHHFDPRLLQLYFRILWNSNSIDPPATIISAADHMVAQIEVHQMINAKAVAHPTEEPLMSTSVDEQIMFQRLFTPRVGSCPPRNYEMLRETSIAALRERGDAILSTSSSFNNGTNLLLRMLVALATAKVFEVMPTVVGWSGPADVVPTNVPRVHAGIVACVIGTLVDLDIEHDGGGPAASLLAVERLRTVVALSAYAEGETDPQVVLETWLLRDALVAAGEYVEAQDVEQDAYRRIEMYISEIAVDSL
jgi:hypothetical protein